jgi:hypothetical protein
MSKKIHGVDVPDDTNIPDESGRLRCRTRDRHWPISGDRGFQLICREGPNIVIAKTYREGFLVHEMEVTHLKTGGFSTITLFDAALK